MVTSPGLEGCLPVLSCTITRDASPRMRDLRASPVGHHYAFQIDGHARKYTLRVQHNATLQVCVPIQWLWVVISTDLP